MVIMQKFRFLVTVVRNWSRIGRSGRFDVGERNGGGDLAQIVLD